MPYAVDDDGNPVGGAYPVTMPSEVPGRMAGAPSALLGAIKRNAAPLTLQSGGQMAGEAIGAMLPPPLDIIAPPVLGAAGAGLANIAASRLPESVGGTPGESKKSAFLWGSIPALIGGVGGSALKARAANKLAKASEEAGQTFEKEAAQEAENQRGIASAGLEGEAPTQATTNRISSLLGLMPGADLSPLTGESRTQATDDAINAVLGPINRMREDVGRPLGEAYKNLKNGGAQISPEEAQGLGDAAKGIREGLIAPAPVARGIFHRLQTILEPDEGMQVAESPFGQENALTGAGTKAKQFQTLGSMSPAQVQQLEKLAAENGGVLPPGALQTIAAGGSNLPTYDELRELRQFVNQRLRSATGGDVHALRSFQSELDNVLSEHLPDNMSQLRTAYRGFIKNYDWRDINKLRRAGTPEEVGDWFFGQNPSVQREVIEKAKPDERSAYRDLFARRIMSAADPSLPPEQQVAQIRKAAMGYLKSGTVKALYGDQRQGALRDVLYSPIHRAAAAKALNTPVGKQTWLNGFMDQARTSGKADRDAAEAGLNAWIDSLPPEQQATVKRYVQIAPSAETPRLLNPAQALAKQMVSNRSKFTAPRFLVAEGLGALPFAAMTGSMGGAFMARYAMGFALMSAGTAGYRALMDAGGADVAARMFASPMGRKAGSAAFKTLALIGGRALHQAKRQPEPVIGVDQ